jgi:hypothetical protein
MLRYTSTNIKNKKGYQITDPLPSLTGFQILTGYINNGFGIPTGAEYSAWILF